MYNLLMAATQDYWETYEGLPFDLDRWEKPEPGYPPRMFYYTADPVKQKFTVDGRPDYHALRKLPCLFTCEGFDVVGSIGRISEVREEGGQYRIIYTLPTVYPKIPIKDNSAFVALGIKTGRNDWERSRSHWAVKDIDLFEATTKLLKEAGNVPVVLTNSEMNRVWGDGHGGKMLAFLSHRASCRKEVARVREELERQGLRCFVAHEDINPSEIWQNEILNALNTMDVFVGFVTDDFHGGGWPDQEVGYACQRGIHRVFVKLEGKDPIGMVAREQALTTGWETAGEQMIAHLKQAGIL